MENYPPYSITDKMLNYVSDIMKKIGEAIIAIMLEILTNLLSLC